MVNVAGGGAFMWLEWFFCVARAVLSCGWKNALKWL